MFAMNFQMIQSAVIPERSRGILRQYREFGCGISRLRFAPLGTKNPNQILGSGFKFYPTDAVQVNLPFPFGKRRMTVAAESDFQ